MCKQSCALLGLLVLSVLATTAGAYDPDRSHPIANFTMNFLKGLDLGKVSFNYIPCVRHVNVTLLRIMDIVTDYKQGGMYELFNSITFILSQIFDVNTTCQVTSRELAYALSQYMMDFKDDNYFLAVLREFLKKAEKWVEQTVKFKSCVYYDWYGCAGLSAGRFVNIIFNATPKKTDYVQQQVRLDSGLIQKRKEFSGRTLRMILNATLNALETSNLLSRRNMTQECRNAGDTSYSALLQALEIALDEHDWDDALYLTLYAMKQLNTIYNECNNVLQDFAVVGDVYLQTLTNPLSILSHAVFRSKPLMSRGMVTVDAIKGKDYEDLGYHIGYLINILLWI